MVPDLTSNLEALFKEKDFYRFYFVQHPFNANYFNVIKEKVNEFLILQSIADENGKRLMVAQENEQLFDKIKLRLKFQLSFSAWYSACRADGVLVGKAMIEYITQGDYGLFSMFIQSSKEAALI